MKLRKHQRGFIVACAAYGDSGTDFSPTYVAAQTSDTGGLAVRAVMDDDQEFSAAHAEARCIIWVETSASETYVRVDITNKDGATEDLDWYNTSGVGQGDPGVDQNAMSLGERVDTVKIRKVSEDVADDGAVSSKEGTFTDDLAFNPTNTLNYGYRINVESTDEGGAPDSDTGNIVIEFTFVKSGFNDLVVEYKALVNTSASSDL